LEEAKEILDEDILDFTTDLLSEMIGTINSHKITKNEKRIEVNVGVNAVRFVIAVLENRINQKEEQIELLKKYAQEKCECVSYKKKYEDLISKMTREKEEIESRKRETSTQTEDNDMVVLTQTEGNNMEVELEVEQDRETNRKLDEILNRIAKIEKREERRKDTSPAWAQVLGRKERKKATRDSSQTSLPGRKLPPKEVGMNREIRRRKGPSTRSEEDCRKEQASWWISQEEPTMTLKKFSINAKKAFLWKD